MVRMLFGLLLLVTMVTGAHARPPLVIATTLSPPLSYPQQNGMLDLIAKAAFARAGIGLSLQVLPSERGLVMADAGQVDGDINRISGLEDKYANLVQVPESNLSYEFMAFTARNDVVVSSWDDLKNYSVGYIIGWKIYDENADARSVVKVATPENLFALLQGRRVDVVLYYRIGGMHYIRELGLDDVHPVEPPLARRDMFMYLNRKHAGLVPRIAKALRDMKADGTYAAIVTPFMGN